MKTNAIATTKDIESDRYVKILKARKRHFFLHNLGTAAILFFLALGLLALLWFILFTNNVNLSQL
jgi:hypothetical protein